MTAKEKLSFLIRCGLRFSSDESRIMDIIREEVNKTPTTSGECVNCDYRKFTEKFINGVVEVMEKNGITSVEQLSEILKGAE